MAKRGAISTVISKDALDRIRNRIMLREEFRGFAEKAAAYRRILGQDYSDVGGRSGRQRVKKSTREGRTKPVNSSVLSEYLDDTAIRQIEQFKSNDLAKGIRTLAHRTHPMAVHYDIEGMPYEDGMLHEKYLNLRLGAEPLGCEAREHMTGAMFDAMTVGVGGVLCGQTLRTVSNEPHVWPRLMYVDGARAYWDRNALCPELSAWSGVELEWRVSEWEALADDGKSAKSVTKLAGDIHPDAIFRGILHFDRDIGEAGTFSVWICQANDVDIYEDPLLVAPLYSVAKVEAYEVPLNPIRFLTYLNLPGVAEPISFVDMSIRHQLDAWVAERQLAELVVLHRPLRMIAKDSLSDEKVVDAIMNPGGPAQVTIQAGDPSKVVYDQMPPAIPQATAALLQSARQDLAATIGHDPYAAGRPVEGVNFAAEAVNLANTGHSTELFVIARHALWMAGIGRTILACASKFDNGWFTLRDGEIEYRFGDAPDRHGPWMMYVRPDAQVVASEESMHARSKDQKVQDALRDLQALGPYFPQYSKMQDELVRNYLGAAGVANPGKYLDRVEVAPEQTGSEAAAAQG